MKTSGVKPYLLQGSLLVLVLAVVFPNVFLHGDLLIPGSFLFDVAPWSHHRPADLPHQNRLYSEVPISVCVWYKLTDNAFRDGEWPLWNPLQFAGAPLLANFQTAVFYPPRLLFRILDDTFLSMTIYLLLRLWLCGFNAFIAARVLGLKSPYSNLLSFAYMLAGYNLLWVYYPPPDAMAWLPIVAVATESILNKRYVRGFALTVVGMTMMILAGHPSTMLTGSIGLGVYAAVRVLRSRGPIAHAARSFGCAAGGVIVSLAICSLQLLPFIEYMPEMELFIYRFIPEGVSHYRYSVFDILSAWNARLLGTELEDTFWGTTNHTYLGMLYLGIPIWLCIALLPSKPSLSSIDRIRVSALLGVSFVCAYFATNFPGADIVQRLPIISGIRPAYFLAFPTLALPLAGVISFQAWTRTPRSMHDLLHPLMGMLVLFFISLIGVVAARYVSLEFPVDGDKRDNLIFYIREQFSIFIVFALFGMVSLLVCVRFPQRTRAAVAALSVILVADHAFAVSGLLCTTPRQILFPHTALTDFLQSEARPCRVRVDSTSILLGYMTLYGVEEATGYDAVYPRRIKPYLDDVRSHPGSPVDALMANQYTLFPQGATLPDGYVGIATMEGVTVAENPASMPRARLVTTIESFTTSEAMFSRMNDEDFNPAAIVYTDEPIDFTLPPSDGSSAGDAVIEEWQSQFVKVRATANKECVLVLADGFYPGWEATIDGAPATIFPAYHLFRGVHVPKGEHVIEFAYRPASFRYGMIISIATLAISCSIALLILWRQRRGVQSILT